MTNSCRISAAKRAELTEKYTALHEGKEPDEFVCDRMRDPEHLRVIGRATAIQYKKEIPDDEPYYKHPWAPHAQPKIAVDGDGKLHFYAGKHETSRRGIEDRVPHGHTPSEFLVHPYIQTEKIANRPTETITLGTLDWIRYKVGVGRGQRERELRFSPEIAPKIAHDQNGNLHVLDGQYRVTSRGVERSMKHRKHHARHNPSSSKRSSSLGSRAGRLFISSLVVGGVATATGILMDMGISRVASLNALSATTKSLVKIGAGVGAGLGLGALVPAAPGVALGVAVGGVTNGLLGLYASYLASRVPAARASLPAGGIPRQYAAVSPAACGVGY